MLRPRENHSFQEERLVWREPERGVFIFNDVRKSLTDHYFASLLPPSGVAGFSAGAGVSAFALSSVLAASPVSAAGAAASVAGAGAGAGASGAQPTAQNSPRAATSVLRFFIAISPQRVIDGGSVEPRTAPSALLPAATLILPVFNLFLKKNLLGKFSIIKSFAQKTWGRCADHKGL